MSNYHKDDLMSYENHSLKAENARLKAEVERLKPKPVVKFGYVNVGDLSAVRSKHDNIQLTFEAGKPVKAEIINQGETK